MKKYFILKENTDNKITYGVLVTNSSYITREKLQDEIDNIKFNMDKELSESYTIEDDILPFLSCVAEIESIEEVFV